MPTYCITGANGFVASHILLRCLGKGHTIHGTVRNKDDEKRIGWLKGLPGASERLKLFSVNMNDENEEMFEAAVTGCDGVFMVASPQYHNDNSDNSAKATGMDEMVKPAVDGTLRCLRACKKAGVKTVVLTSSMVAANRNLEVLDGRNEEDWADDEEYAKNNAHYELSKLRQERAAYKFVEDEGQPFRLCSLLPGIVMGRSVGPELPTTTAQILAGIYATLEYPPFNVGMNYVDPQDTAELHIACMEKEDAKGRYLCTNGWLHANDALGYMKADLGKYIPEANKPIYEGPDPLAHHEFDLTKMKTLGVDMRPLREVFRGAHEEFMFRGLVGNVAKEYFYANAERLMGIFA